MQRTAHTRKGVLLVVSGFVLLSLAFGGAWALAPDRTAGTPTQADSANGDATNTSVLVGVQGPGRGGSVVELDANGTVLWSYGGGTGGETISYQNAQMLDDGTVLSSFADDGYRNCGPFSPSCKRTGARVIDPRPDPTVVAEWSIPVRTRKDSEVHDVERLPSGDVLAADMEYEGILVANLSTGEHEWIWNASRYYDAPPDPTKTDWLHVNDVDRIGDGRFLVSVRNANQLVVVERGEGVVEVINEDRNRSILYEQHNPHWLGDGRVLVADSENDRVVELHRNETTGEWSVAWTVTDAGGIDLSWPRDADRLPNGHTVITDSRNDRVVVVDGNGTMVRSYATPPLPYEADILPYGERPGLANASAAAGTANETASADVPVFSTVLGGLHHVVAVPYWVSELHLIAVTVALVLWGTGGYLIAGDRRR